jgi:hypothetical protein
MGLLAIVNPACGDLTGPAFVTTHVLPLLASSRQTPTAIETTAAPGHAGTLVLDFLRASSEDKKTPTTVLVASGDGTVHEIVDALSAAPDAEHFAIEFVLVPVGTANALFATLFPPGPDEDVASPSYHLRSLHAFLAGTPPRPLTIAATTISAASDASSSVAPRLTVRAAVVTSTALHAAILHSSEALRASIPGIERFKRAAAENIPRWSRARATLLPSSGGGIQQYSPAQRAFLPVQATDTQDGTLALDGPFSYFLCTTTVDRLEPAFRIAPLVVRLPPAPADGPCVDVLAVRPARDPAYAGADTAEARAAFVPKVTEVLYAAYRDGAHVDIVYAPDGSVVGSAEAGEGKPVVEYFRCGGWEWAPEDGDESASVLCADGTIFTLERGESARCAVQSAKESAPTFAAHGP